jgi:serine/threonine-protein kinase
LGDRYRLIREIGRGGMAIVWLAQDLKLSREVAVKVLLGELAFALGPERFRREIDVVSRLSHPNVLPIDDYGEFEGQMYYVMPFITGETIHKRLERERQLNVQDAVKIAFQVASALDYAHRQGIVHRDIKPENILLQDGEALVADFGIARAITEAAAPSSRARASRRHADVHEPRAGDGRSGDRRPERHLQLGLRAVRDAGRTAAVLGSDRASDHRAPPAR